MSLSDSSEAPVAPQVAQAAQLELIEQADRVFGLITALCPDHGPQSHCAQGGNADPAPHITKEQLVAAHGHDFKLFEQIDRDGDGVVTLTEWHEFLRRTHVERGLKGDKWLLSILATLSRRLKVDEVQPVALHDKEWHRLNDSEWYASWDEALEEARETYDMINALEPAGGGITEAKLTQAQKGNFGLFKKIDPDASGTVTYEEWIGYIQKTHETKGDKGDRWVSSFLHTVRRHLKPGEGTLQIRICSGWELKLDQASEAFLSLVGQEDDLLTAELFYSASTQHTAALFGAEFRSMHQSPGTPEGVSLDAWVAWARRAHSQEGGAARLERIFAYIDANAKRVTRERLLEELAATALAERVAEWRWEMEQMKLSHERQLEDVSQGFAGKEALYQAEYSGKLELCKAECDAALTARGKEHEAALAHEEEGRRRELAAAEESVRCLEARLAVQCPACQHADSSPESPPDAGPSMHQPKMKDEATMELGRAQASCALPALDRSRHGRSPCASCDNSSPLELGSGSLNKLSLLEQELAKCRSAIRSRGLLWNSPPARARLSPRSQKGVRLT